MPSADRGSAASQVLTAASELASMSEGLRTTVNDFVGNIRAA